MSLLLMLIIWLGGAFVTFPFATRSVYNRRSVAYDSPLHAYSDALSIGGAIALFWPVTLPSALLLEATMATARMTAPPEVKRLISQRNTEMLERALGQKQQHELEWNTDGL